MNEASKEFNKQLELDVLINGLTEVTYNYVASFNRYKLTDVIIPEGITSISGHAFRDCHKLITVKIPDSVTNIGEYAFYWCTRLTSVSIGKGVTRLEDNVFMMCDNLRNVELNGRSLATICSIKDYQQFPEKIVYTVFGI